MSNFYRSGESTRSALPRIIWMIRFRSVGWVSSTPGYVIIASWMSRRRRDEEAHYSLLYATSCYQGGGWWGLLCCGPYKEHSRS